MIFLLLLWWFAHSIILHRLSPDKREEERGSRQQDLRQQGLSKGGTMGGGVSVGRASMNQQPSINSKSGLWSYSDTPVAHAWIYSTWYFTVLFTLRKGVAHISLNLCIFSEPTGQPSPSASTPFNRTSGRWVTFQHRWTLCMVSFCMFGYINYTNNYEQIKHSFKARHSHKFSIYLQLNHLFIKMVFGHFWSHQMLHCVS